MRFNIKGSFNLLIIHYIDLWTYPTLGNKISRKDLTSVWLGSFYSTMQKKTSLLSLHVVMISLA